MPANRGGGGVETMEAAERALALSAQPDYTRPSADSPFSVDPRLLQAQQKFERICFSGGDPASCLKAPYTVRQEPRMRSRIGDNCRSGHDLSCRFLDEERSSRLSTAELRRGCAAGVRHECYDFEWSKDPAEVRFAKETLCYQDRLGCGEAANSYFLHEPRDLRKARDLYELACQNGDHPACVGVEYEYFDGDLVEPVPGRGEQIHRFLCSANGGAYCDPLIPRR